MSEQQGGRKPIGRITVRNKDKGIEMTVATMWPRGDAGTEKAGFSISLGASAYKERAAVSDREAVAALLKGNTKNSGYFINGYFNRENLLAHLGVTDAGPGPEEVPMTDAELEEIPF